MFTRKSQITTCLVCWLVCFSLAGFSAVAQTEDLEQTKQKAEQLLKQVKYVEALPLLEKIVAAEPSNARMRYNLASALLGQAANMTDDASRKALRIRARNEFIKARDLGVEEPNIEAMIQGLPLDGSESAFSKDQQAHKVMIAAEALFSQGKLDEAFKEY